MISGQCFRWSRADDGSLRGVLRGRCVVLRQEDDRIFVSGCEPDMIREYLDMDTDYEAIREECLKLEPRLRSVSIHSGLHILRQEPWEALCSFVISQNNNIPRIRLIISRLCALCGIKASGGGAGEMQYAFPPAETVARLDVDALDRIGCGYRSEYIIIAAKAVRDGLLDFDELRRCDIDAARKRLMALKGIGPKVADCFLLYGLHRLECFPRDVWIKRALEGEFKDTPLQSSRFAGVAQQYIFEYIRAKTGSEANGQV